MENVIRNLTKLTHNVHIIEGGIAVLSVVLELDKGHYPENLLFFFLVLINSVLKKKNVFASTRVQAFLLCAAPRSKLKFPSFSWGLG